MKRQSFRGLFIEPAILRRESGHEVAGLVSSARRSTDSR